MRKKIIILGVTGSIGQGTLDVIRKNGSKFNIIAASAHFNEQKLISISKEFNIPFLALSGRKSNNSIIKFSGKNSILHMLEETEADIVLNGIAGAEGLPPSIVSLKSGKDLALANKETIVMAGRLIMKLAKDSGRKILPVDSEHSAIFNLLENRNINSVKEIILTASGGPFRLTDLSDFSKITLEDALQHPTWDMGRKITIDSATMANKGLEIIEAHGLFSFPGEKIKVLIHPESRVHSLIRLSDASMYAQISNPDMKIPIANALFYPSLINSTFGELNLAGKSLNFFEADFRRYPMLELAYETVSKEGSYSIAYNAANEIAVDYFINKKIKFIDIPSIVSDILSKDWSHTPESFEDIFETDLNIRETTKEYIKIFIRNKQ